MNRLLLKLLIPLCAFLFSNSGFAATATPATATKQVIRIGAASSPKYGAVFDAMKRDFERNGVTLEYTLYPDYYRLVDALVKHEVDIAWNTPMAHARAMALTNGHAIGTVVRDIDVQYAAQIVVRKDSGINDLKDLVGKKVALGSIESAELHALPKYYLKQQGLDLDKQAQIMNLTGLVDDQMSPISAATNVLAAISSKQADAGAVGEVTTRALRADPNSPLKVIWTSPRYTHCIMTALDDFNPALIAKFKEVLLKETMEDPIGKEVMVNEGNDKVWLDGSQPRESRDSFLPLLAAIKEQNIQLTKPAFDITKPVYRVGTVASTEALRALDAMQRYFMRQGEKQFEYYLYGTQQQLSDALFNRKVDVAWTGPLPSAQNLIRDQKILVQLASDAEAGYHFRVVVRKDSGINGLQDLNGKKLVLGSNGAAELSALPRFYLPKAGLDLAKVNVVSLNGKVDAVTLKPTDGDSFVASAVQNGQGDAGVVGDEVAKQINADAGSPLKVIWTSPAFARRIMAALPDYKYSSQFTRVMQSMTPNDPIAGVVLSSEKSTKWMAPSANEAYKDLIEALKQEYISMR